MTTLRDFGVGNTDVEAGGTTLRDADVGVTLGAAMGDVVLVTEDAAEPTRDVCFAVETPAVGRLERERRHADHPLSETYLKSDFVREFSESNLSSDPNETLTV